MTKELKEKVSVDTFSAVLLAEAKIADKAQTQNEEDDVHSLLDSMGNFIIIVNHNRHTDDEFFVFPNTEDGAKKARKFFHGKKNHIYPNGNKLNIMGEDDWGYSEDYVFYICKSSN
jgi:hypothetical protein